MSSSVSPAPQVLEVWGDLACFSRPELKVERFSYPVITPSATRGIFDAVYCKPLEFRWQVSRIEMLAMPSYIALQRNEVKQKVSMNAVIAWMGGGDPEPIWADGDGSIYSTDTKGRTQRQTMALRDVRYRLHAEIRPWRAFRQQQRVLEGQFVRRASKGKCFQQPYFGCREFPAYFEYVYPADGGMKAPVPYSADLGFMLYDVFDLSRQGTPQSGPAVSLFHAQVLSGILDVPAYDSESVLKAGDRV
jgi:CRISPR-associated protein Cas5d